jgi:iron-sulfur cluster assembly protein
MEETKFTYQVGNEKLICLTEHAGKRVSSLLREQSLPSGALRIAVVGGGCSGLQYKMDLVDGPVEGDILVESHGIRVVIDPKSAPFIGGSVLDCSEDLQKGGFRVTNPNAEARCSCGDSFSA